MALSRLKARATPQHADADVTREISVGGRLNSALTALLRAEVWLTLAGVRWPFGGSRIVVARAVSTRRPLAPEMAMLGSRRTYGDDGGHPDDE